MRDASIASLMPQGLARLPARMNWLVIRMTNKLIQATPRQVIDVPTREPIVSFTFDDVPDSALGAGATILEAHGVRGTFYIAGGLQGQVEPNRTLIDARGCSELASRGHEIGCHTYGHHDVRHIGRSSLQTDLARNADYLNGVDPRPGRRNFAYPYGSASFGKRDMMTEAFRSCRAGGEAINRGPTDPAFLCGVEIRQPEEFVSELTSWIDALLVEPGWLIFFTHDISPTPTPYGCTPAGFDRLVRYSLESGCSVLTVDAALNRMGLREQVR